nr:protein FLX-like 1 [Tanacetum cinerariifolium]
MPRRNRRPSLSMKGGPHGGRPPIHEPPFGRNLGPRPHPALLEETREAQIQMGPHKKIPPHPGIFKERLAVQHQDIQALLVDNQRLAATHAALKQELKATQHELQQNDNFAQNILMEKDMQLRGLYKKSAKMEHDLHRVEGMRAELMQVHANVKELTATRQKLTAQVQAMTQALGRANADSQQVLALKVEGMRAELMQVHANVKELTATRQKLTAQVQAMTQALGRANADSQQVLALKSEIGGLRQELQHARALIEHEKKVHAENNEHDQVMKKNLLTMAQELEKLRAEMANAEKRASATAATANP